MNNDDSEDRPKRSTKKRFSKSIRVQNPSTVRLLETEWTAVERPLEEPAMEKGEEGDRRAGEGGGAVAASPRLRGQEPVRGQQQMERI